MGWRLGANEGGGGGGDAEGGGRRCVCECRVGLGVRLCSGRGSGVYDGQKLSPLPFFYYIRRVYTNRDGGEQGQSYRFHIKSHPQEGLTTPNSAVVLAAVFL